MTQRAQPSQPLSQPQMPNTVLSSALNESFQKCYKTTVPKLMQETLPSNAVAAFERPAIQNMTAPIPFRHILNFSATEDQQIYDARVRMIKPIADCMRQEQQQPYQQQQPYSSPSYQQQLNNNYALPRILSHSAYTSSTGTVHIVGEVINQSPITAKFVKIIMTLYNAYNQVIGTDYAYTQPTDLAPGQRAPFDILVLSGGIAINQVRNYALTVDAS